MDGNNDETKRMRCICNGLGGSLVSIYSLLKTRNVKIQRIKKENEVERELVCRSPAFLFLL
jgi:hypothetical protein